MVIMDIYKRKYLFLLKKMKEIKKLDYSFGRMHPASVVSSEALDGVRKILPPRRVAFRQHNPTTPYFPSPELAVIVGRYPISTVNIVKKIWEYIKNHNLQDPTNRRMINADDSLKKIFGKNRVSLFEISTLIRKNHLYEFKPAKK